MNARRNLGGSGWVVKKTVRIYFFYDNFMMVLSVLGCYVHSVKLTTLVQVNETLFICLSTNRSLLECSHDLSSPLTYKERATVTPLR